MEDDDARNDMEKLFKILNAAGGGAKSKPKAQSGASSMLWAWAILISGACVTSLVLGFLGRLVCLGYHLASKIF